MLKAILKIDYPIMQGGMALVSDAKLAAAVSNGGGAGIIASFAMKPEELRAEIKKAKSLTKKPFGVNVMLMSTDIEGIVDVCCEEKIAFATFGAGNPIPYFERMQSAGIKCLPVIANVKQAKKVADAGADAIIAEGMESGGHIGTLTTMALMTQVIPAVDIPVVVAGGIGDGRGIAAALVMGAAGVQMGTAFLVAEECRIHENAKKRIIEAVETDSVVIGSTVKGEAMRGLVCPVAESYLAAEKSGKSESELKKIALSIDYDAAFLRGELEKGMLLCGQSLRSVEKIAPAKEIIARLMKETELALSCRPEY